MTTGASSDLRQATRLAREMITKYGFSERLGLASTEYSDYGLSHETRLVIEAVKLRLLEEANQRRRRRLLKKHEGSAHARQATARQGDADEAPAQAAGEGARKSGDASFIGRFRLVRGVQGGERGRKAETSGAGAMGRRHGIPRLPRPRRKPRRRQRLPQAEQPRALEPHECDDCPLVTNPTSTAVRYV